MENTKNNKEIEREQVHGVYPDPGHKNDVRIGPLEKSGSKLLKSVEDGNMVAIVSGTEIMYTFIFRNMYQCFIHPMDSEDGRFKSFPVNERNTAMIKNLDSTADHLFEIEFDKNMDMIGVMVAAEPGIINYLDMTGNLPGQDMDFMEWQDNPQG